LTSLTERNNILQGRAGMMMNSLGTDGGGITLCLHAAVYSIAVHISRWSGIVHCWKLWFVVVL